MYRFYSRTSNAIPRAFTLVELLVVISVISVLLSILLPALGGVRQQAKSVRCQNQVRQLGMAFHLYANDYDGFALPTWYKNTFWWGKPTADHIDHEAGTLWPYLVTALEEDSVYQCPSQPFGSYGLQGKPTHLPNGLQWITSTYGYNGYYLSPPASRWQSIAHRPWQKLSTITGPETTAVFADTLLRWGSGPQARITNTALLDPPMLLMEGQWKKNTSPTTCFRHNDRTNAVFADGHVAALCPSEEGYSDSEAKVGSAAIANGPYYVPDYKDWVID